MPRIKLNNKLIESEEPLDQTPLLEGEVGDIGQAGSPLAAEQAGASPDQAKMVNTPNAREGLISKITSKAKDTLSGSKRLKQPTKEKMSEADIQYQDRLSKLGGLGSSIQRMVDTQLAEAAQKDTKLTIDENVLSGLTKDKQEVYTSGIESLNQTIAQGGDINGALIDLKNKLLPEGDEKGMSTLAAENIKDALDKDIADVIAAQVAAGVVDPEDVNINTLLNAGIMEIEDLGLTEEELSSALGSNWINMNPKQISSALDRQNAIKYGEADELTTLLNSPTTSPAQQEDIRDRLADMGASGALQATNEAETIAKQVEDSGLVEFGGEIRDIDELLSDEGMETMITDFLEGDDAFRKKFKDQNPQFAMYLEQNEENLKDTMASISESETTLNEIRDENKKQFIFGTTDMTDETIKAIFPDYEPGSFTSDKIDSDNPLWKFLKANPEEAADMVTNLNNLAEIDPDLVSDAMEIADGDPKKLQKFLIELQDPESDLVESARINKGFDKLSKDSTVEELTNWMFGDDSNLSSVTEDLAAAKAAANYDPESKKKYKAMKSILDADGDGELDASEEIYNRLMGIKRSSGGLEGLMDGESSQMSDLVKTSGQGIADLESNPIYAITKEYLKGENDSITGKEANKILKGDISFTQLDQILDSGINMSFKAKERFIAKGKRLIRGELAAEYAQVTDLGTKEVLEDILSGKVSDLVEHESLVGAIDQLKDLAKSATGIKKIAMEDSIKELDLKVAAADVRRIKREKEEQYLSDVEKEKARINRANRKAAKERRRGAAAVATLGASETFRGATRVGNKVVSLFE